MAQLWGLRRNGQLAALLCPGKPVHGPQVVSVGFLDGVPAAIAELARRALSLTGVVRYIEAVVPRWNDTSGAALAVLQDLGFAV